MREDRTRTRRRLAAAAAGAVILAAAVAAGDVIELTNGRRYEGLVLEQDPMAVRFKVVFPKGGSMTRAFRRSEIKTLTLTGDAPTASAPEDPPEKEDPPSDRPPRLSRDEVKGRIRVIGPSPPDWWNQVELTYPDTLDLDGTQASGDGRPEVDLAAYVAERIRPDRRRWREGVKLLHHVIKARKADPARRAEAMELLGDLYFDLFNDWVRAAHWYETSMLHRRRVRAVLTVRLAECYWRIGSREMAVETLRRFRQDMHLPSAMAAQLWCQMGYAGGAMKMAEKMIADPQRADEGHLAAGNIRRYTGRLDEAIEHYEQAAALTTGSRYLERRRRRARANLAAVKALRSLDLSRVPDGAHRGEAVGYKGPVVVKVHVADGAITGVEIVSRTEDRAGRAFDNAAERILVHPDFAGIDATTGASTTGDAVTNATIDALHKAQR
ncbi:MAG: FMN-binding protein [Planctomycetota bacterium]